MKKILLIATCLSLSLCVLGASPACAEDDILINDFEAADYGDWTVEGGALGKGPAKGTLGGQRPVSGFEGRGLVNTFLGGDEPTGTLTSPEFTIERDYIKFLTGGAVHKTSARPDMGQPIGKISLTAEGGPLVVASFGGHEMKSIWDKWPFPVQRGARETEMDHGESSAASHGYSLVCAVSAALPGIFSGCGTIMHGLRGRTNPNVVGGLAG